MFSNSFDDDTGLADQRPGGELQADSLSFDASEDLPSSQNMPEHLGLQLSDEELIALADYVCHTDNGTLPGQTPSSRDVDMRLAWRSFPSLSSSDDFSQYQGTEHPQMSFGSIPLPSGSEATCSIVPGQTPSLQDALDLDMYPPWWPFPPLSSEDGSSHLQETEQSTIPSGSEATYSLDVPPIFASSPSPSAEPLNPILDLTKQYQFDEEYLDQVTQRLYGCKSSQLFAYLVDKRAFNIDSTFDPVDYSDTEFEDIDLSGAGVLRKGFDTF